MITNKHFALVTTTFNRYKQENETLIQYKIREKMNIKHTFSSSTNPSLPSVRTVVMIMTGFSFPWNTSAVPTVTSSKLRYLSLCVNRKRCLRYGVTTPMSDCVICLKPNSFDFGGNNCFRTFITSSISLLLKQLPSID